MSIIDYREIESFFVQGCGFYAKSAPVVARHLDEIYILINDGDKDLRWNEVIRLLRLHDDEGWVQPNYAANYVYKLRQEYGRAVTGYAGF